MKGIFAGLAVVLAASAAQAEDYDGIPDRFFEKLAAHEYMEAGQALNIPKEKFSDLEIETLFTSSFKGDYKYHELVSSEKTGTRIVKLTYIVGMDQKPAGAIIALYKPETRWQVTGLSFYENYLTMVKEKKTKQ